MFEKIVINKKKLAIRIVTITILLILFVSLLLILGSRDKTKKTVLQKMNIDKVDSINYIVTTGGNKTNISKEITIDKNLENMLIKHESLIYDNKVSKLKAKITNNEITKENLRIKAKFITSNGKILTEIVMVVGKFSANAIKDIDITIDIDVSNARYIVYEVVK
jgi:hypothetical protein